ncbi:hypothetical protein [Phycicoccus sp. 3266]|uniref:hypothetical protein n=1 Tax=Phycicoccus sp. 3266 TaxID=2817751 RepID=UPI0028575036|nr:hypothetical protein [Phycicoccus sp. 3266]MDR6861996.1 hypothetical protein [Phycicoccus sp. 3266]
MSILSRMVIPRHEPSSGEVTLPPLDVRKPRLWDADDLGYTQPRRLGWWRRERCTDGMHLFDVLVAEQTRYADDDTETIRFDATLTCVRCGLVQRWDGTRAAGDDNHHDIDPTPVQAGELLAQQIRSGSLPHWIIHRDGAPVGAMEAARTRRGRSYIAARLDEWAPGDTVEGKDPRGALRAVARRVQMGSPTDAEAGQRP